MADRLKRLERELGLAAAPSPFEMDPKTICRRVEAALSAEERERKYYMKHKIRLAAVLTAAVMTLTGTALAAGPTISEALQAALGAFIPYAQQQEGAVEDMGIRVKVLSALTDDLCTKVYLEVTDLTGDRLEQAKISGTLNVTLESETVWVEGCQVVDYDPETRTALVCVKKDAGVFFPEETEGTVVLFATLSHRDGSAGYTTPEPVKGRWELPVKLRRAESSVSPLSGLIDHSTLTELRLSPLGVALASTSPDHSIIGGYPLTVFLSDGTSFHPEAGIYGHQGDGISLARWEFDRPVEVDDITGVALGCWMIPVQNGVAGEGFWLSQLPE